MVLPNVALIATLFAMYGKEVLKNTPMLLSTGIYTIVNFALLMSSYFILENNREKSIRVLDEGLVYNSLAKKFAVPWTDIYKIEVNPFPGGKPALMVYTVKGRFYFNGMFVDINEETPKIKPGLLRPKFYYHSGGGFNGDLYKSELYGIFREKVPDKFV